MTAARLAPLSYTANDQGSLPRVRPSGAVSATLFVREIIIVLCCRGQAALGRNARAPREQVPEPSLRRVGGAAYTAGEPGLASLPFSFAF